jgi:hypothetical protein
MHRLLQALQLISGNHGNVGRAATGNDDRLTILRRPVQQRSQMGASLGVAV